MSVKFPVAVCLCAAFDIDAGELRDSSHGLQVEIENLEGAIEVNGVRMAITRATGPGVAALARRVVDQWRLESGAESVRVIPCCGWNVASRLSADESEVIQWRSSAGGELLRSTADLATATQVAPAPKTPLISSCKWSTPVQGRVGQRQFLQVSAHCNVEATRALDLAARRLAESRWQWQRRGPLVLQAELGAVQAQLTAAPAANGRTDPTAGASSLVLIESQPAAGITR